MSDLTALETCFVIVASWAIASLTVAWAFGAFAYHGDPENRRDDKQMLIDGVLGK